MWLYPCPDLGKPSNKKNRKCGFIPQEGGLCPNPQILKSLDFLFFWGGVSWIQNTQILNFFLGWRVYFKGKLVKFFSLSECEGGGNPHFLFFLF